MTEERTMVVRTHPERRREMLAGLLGRLKAWRNRPGENYPLDVVERELLLEALEAGNNGT
jgi:hypothetical protein